MITPTLEEGLHKDEAFMRSPGALERYIKVAQMGSNTQMACQIHLQQASYPDLPRYSPSPLPHGFNTVSFNSLTGLPEDIVRHTLEIDGHAPRQAEEYIRKLGFKFEVDESDDWICRTADGNCVLACTNCDRWYMHNPVNCDKTCRMCHSPPDKHTQTCIHYKAWACKHSIQIPPEKGKGKAAAVDRLSTSQASRRARAGDRHCLQMLDNSRLGKHHRTPDQSSRMPAIIEQFAHITAEAAHPIDKEHAQRLNEQAEFVAALHEQAVDTILATPEEP